MLICKEIDKKNRVKHATEDCFVKEECFTSPGGGRPGTRWGGGRNRGSGPNIPPLEVMTITMMMMMVVMTMMVVMMMTNVFDREGRDQTSCLEKILMMMIIIGN